MNTNRQDAYNILTEVADRMTQDGASPQDVLKWLNEKVNIHTNACISKKRHGDDDAEKFKDYLEGAEWARDEYIEKHF